MSNLQFSELVCKANQTIYNKILQHPFNQQLLDGTLDSSKFSYYIEQDSIYLQEYSKALALIATKLPSQDLIGKFIDFAKGALIAEQEGVHDYFRNYFKHKTTDKVSLACLGYTSYLIKCASTEAIEVAIAAVIPCFWVYNEVGHYIKRHSQPSNLYQKWIDNYASAEFSEGVQLILSIADRYYADANDFTRSRMIQAFENSLMWEYYFWDDSYSLNNFICA